MTSELVTKLRRLHVQMRIARSRVRDDRDNAQRLRDYLHPTSESIITYGIWSDDRDLNNIEDQDVQIRLLRARAWLNVARILRKRK